MTGETATGDQPASDHATGQRRETGSSQTDRETTPRTDGPGQLARGLRFAAAERERFVGAVGAVALVAVLARTALTVLVNLPFDPIAVSPIVQSLVTGAMPAVVALALAAIAVTDERPAIRVGLLFAAVFGCFGLLAPAATVPAVVAVAGGGTLALAGSLGLPTDGWTYLAVRRRVVAGGFLAGIAISLAAATAILPGFRWLGGSLTVLTVAAVGTRSEGHPLAAGAGVFAALALVYVSVTSPYLVGTALLVAFAVTGVPNLLVALAVAGGVAAVVAGLLGRDGVLAVGAGLVLVAGIPASLPRAMALLLGVCLVVLEWDQSTSEVSR